MKTKMARLIVHAPLALVLCAACELKAQTTAFTYQGQLNDSGGPANGNFDFRSSIFDSAANGSLVGGPLTNATTTVSNGLFTVTLDFGAGIFTGADRWLEIGVVATGGGAFVTLTPRQRVASSPYAIQAAHAATAASANAVNAGNILGTLALAQLPAIVVTNGQTGLNLAGAFSGSGAGLSGVNLPIANAFGAIAWTTNPPFVLASSPVVGSSPLSVVAADVNGDGKVDLISANFDANTLSVLTNNGSGGFALASSPGVGSFPRSVVAADVNGDGKMDLITANNGGNTLSVLTNTGSGGFALASSPGVGLTVSVVAADVNGDGKADLISANSADKTLSVLTNNGSGGFVIASSPGLGGNKPYMVAAADINGDGKVDLITANSGPNPLLVLTNDGTGGFVVASSPGVGSIPNWVVAADVNGDGNVDLITANSGTNTLSVLTNDGSGGFVLASSPGVGSGSSSLIAADVNGDGKVDLISANQADNNLSVLTNDGRGGFVLAFSPGVGSLPHSVAAADVNGDGRVDLISANISASTLSVLSNALPFTAHFTGSGVGLTDVNVNATHVIGVLDTAQIPDLDTSKITSGTLATAQIPNLDASKITSGTLATAQIPGLDASKITSGTLAAAQIPNLDASKITSGTLAAAQIPNLDASKITSGTLTDARLSANVALLGGTNVFTGPNQLTGVLVATNGVNQLSGSFTGNGGGLTNLSGSQLTGLVPLAQLPAAVVTNGATQVSLAGSFSGDGSGVTNLDASSVASGSLADALLSTNVALLNRSVQSFTGGTNTFAGNVGIGFNTPQGALHVKNPGTNAGNTLILGGDAHEGGDTALLLGLSQAADGYGYIQAVRSSGSAWGDLILSPNAGNVGIGTTVAFNTLHVKGSIAARTSTTTDGFINLQTGGPTNQGYIEWHRPGPTRVAYMGFNSAGLNNLNTRLESGANYIIDGGNVGIGTNAPQANLHVAGSILVNGTITGDGSGLSSLNAASLTGAVADARLTANVPLLNGTNVFSGTDRFAGVVVATNAVNQLAGNGASLTALNAGNLASGTVADARLSANVALLNANQIFSASNNFAGVTTLTNVKNTLAGTHAGNGASLTSLSAANLASGTLADARLSANVALLNGNQTFSGSNTFSSVAALTNLNNTLAGNHSGNGAALTSLNAANLASGTLADTRLSANVALLNANQTFSGVASLTNVNNALIGTHSGNGVGLTGLGANNIASGTLADQRLSANVPMLNGTNRFAGVVLATNVNNQLSGVFTGNAAGLTNLSAANLTGSVPSASLTSVPAANLTGTVADALLSANVGLLNGTNVFTGTNRFPGEVTVTNLNNLFAGTFTGTLYASAPYLKFLEVTTNAPAGSSVIGTNNFRNFNVKLNDTLNLGSTNGTGDINLPAGTYQCHISAPAFRVETHQIRLRTTTGTTLLFGTIGYSDSSTGGSEDRTQIDGQFTLAATTTLHVQHYCTIAKAGDGLGTFQTFNWGDTNQTVFAVAEFWKIK